MRVKYKTAAQRSAQVFDRRVRNLDKIEAATKAKKISPLLGLIAGLVSTVFADFDDVALPSISDARCPDASGELCFVCASRRRKLGFFWTPATPGKVVH